MHLREWTKMALTGFHFSSPFLRRSFSPRGRWRTLVLSALHLPRGDIHLLHHEINSQHNNIMRSRLFDTGMRNFRKYPKWSSALFKSRLNKQELSNDPRKWLSFKTTEFWPINDIWGFEVAESELNRPSFSRAECWHYTDRDGGIHAKFSITCYSFLSKRISACLKWCQKMSHIISPSDWFCR